MDKKSRYICPGACGSVCLLLVFLGGDVLVLELVERRRRVPVFWGLLLV